jgi:hypothetical protein
LEGSLRADFAILTVWRDPNETAEHVAWAHPHPAAREAGSR